MNQCCLSSVEVVSYCDDLVTEILLRLPLDSVFKFKCVSKTWNRLMSDPIFRAKYISRAKNSLLPLLGFFRVTVDQQDRTTPKLSFLPNCKERKFTNLDCIENYGLTQGSPQGLMLCWSQQKRSRIYNDYVWEPVRNQWFPIPEEPKKGNDFEDWHFSDGLYCEECSKDGVVHFKVIRAMLHRASHHILTIKSFSSRTGNWTQSFLTSPSEFSLGHQRYKGRSVGGIFYWKVCGHFAAYHPENENRMWLIKLPHRSEREGYMDFILGQSPDGCLRFALNEKHQFRMWDLKKRLSSYSLFESVASSEWKLKEVVSFKKFRLINYKATGHDPYTVRLNKYPTLMAFHPANSKLVYLRLGGRVFCYDFDTRILEPIQYPGIVLIYDGLIPYFQPPWLPSLPSRSVSI
ncbi:F-box protein At5g03970-like [Cornus florida]|uniref:F-box protein At5g03970-like n=1 Tax=Cornus florida TaxID=4283 RepID=UPI00289E2401|nr:F-box protein At5g03970-like [Cornus florida]